MESFFEKVEDQTSAINSIADFLKDTEKKRKSDKTADLTKKSAAAAGGKGEAGGLLKGFSLKDISDNIVQLSKGLLAFAKAEAKGAPKSFITFLKDLQGVLTSEGALKNPAQIAKMYESIGLAIKYMGEGLGWFSFGLMMFAIPAKLKITDMFISFVEKFFSPKVMGKLDAKKAKAVGDALSALATGILKFAGYLVLATLAMVIGGPGLLIILPAIMLTMGVMSMFAKKAKAIKEGSEAIQKMALGLLFFAGALVIMRFVRPEDLLIAIGVIAVFGLFVLMLGMIGKLVKGGMKGLKNAGRAVVELSGGLIVFTLALIVMRFVQWEDIFKAVLVVAVFGLFMYIMGESKDVQKGAIAFLIISLSMLLLVFTIQQFAEVEWETIMKTTLALAAVTLAVYVVGKNLKSALMGSIAILIVSGAVWVLGYALKSWQDSAITDETLVQVGLAIGGITIVLVAMGLVGWAVIAGAVALAIVAGTLVGGLYLMGLALEKYKAIGWTEDDMNSLEATLIAVPSAITNGFLEGGGPMLLLAIPAIGLASLALYPIVEAMNVFKKSGVTEEDAISAGAVVSEFINAVKEPIVAVGKGGGLFSDSDFENGLEAIDGLGSTVAEIAAGVLAASRLEYKSLTGKIVKVTPQDFATVGTNVAAMIDALKDPIMEIGSNSKPAEPSGLLGALGLNMLLPDDNDFRQGVKAISGVGELISAIAKGVLEMTKLEFKGLDGKIVKITTNDFATVGNNITAMIDAMKEPIISIGKGAISTDTGIAGWFLGKANTVQNMVGDAGFAEGMEAVGGLGSLVSGIAQGIKDIGGGEFVDPENLKGPKLNALALVPKVATTIMAMINALADPISQIGKDSMQTDVGIAGWLFGDSIQGDKIRTLKYAGFAEGMEALGGLGGLVSGMANAIRTFGVGKIADPSDPTGKTYINVLDLIPKMTKSFDLIVSGMTSPMLAIARINPKILTAATEKSKEMTDMMKNMGKMVKSATEAVLAYQSVKDFDKSLTASMTSVNTAVTALFGKGTFAKPQDIAQFDKLTKGIIKLADAGPKLKGVAEAMKSISESLVKVFTSLNTVMEEKLSAVALMLEKLVEVDKVDAAELQKKIEAYKTYLELVNSMSSANIEKIKEMQTSTSASMESVFKDIATALEKLAKNSDTSTNYLRKIVKNTLDDSGGGEA